MTRPSLDPDPLTVEPDPTSMRSRPLRRLRDDVARSRRDSAGWPIVLAVGIVVAVVLLVSRLAG